MQEPNGLLIYENLHIFETSKNIEVASLKVALSVLNHQYSLTNSQGDIIIERDRGVNQ